MSVSNLNSADTSPGTLGGAASATSSATSSTAATGSDALGENQFLQIFSAELANQDPSSPMDSSQLASQLAQFSSVEQLTDVNTNLQQLMVSQGAQSQVADASLIGTQVMYSSNSVSLTAGQPVSLDASYATAPAQVTVTIQNSAGQTVRTMQLGPQPAGQSTVSWDGMDDNGNPLPSGNYTATITAADVSGNPITVTQESTGIVSGITFTNGYPQLVVNGVDIDLSNISQINQAANQAVPTP
jgi:flagellar basal-body rod modification protein FlgD